MEKRRDKNARRNLALDILKGRMGLFLIIVEFDAKSQELEHLLIKFINSSGGKIKISKLEKLDEHFKHCELWNNPKYKTDVHVKDNEIIIEVMLGQPQDVADLFVSFLGANGGNRKKYD